MKKILSIVLALMLVSVAAVAEGEITVLTREDGSGTRGAFIELFGIEQKNDAGEKEAADLPILVRSARVPTGGVSGAYRKETPGGLRVIPSHDLNPQKAYILLKLALAVTDDPSEIKRMFEQY